MDSPYRSAQTSTVTHAPRDSGIVTDIIGQFADRFAFYRELVQNAIDADSVDVRVTAIYDDSDKVIRVAVSDSGAGMPRDIIENRLLVLFRSTKENDDTKIGKFGVGFASVLAVNPQVIRVISVCDGERLTLHLYPDLSYELFDTGRAQKSGTTVELEIPLEPGDLEEFVQASWQALSRWCRHATVPIHFEARSAAGAILSSARIDEPLELPNAIVSVKHVSPDGAMTVIVGLSADTRPYAGFFNYGLTLYETTEPMVGHLAFKVQDARLGHTLSRDNVRRDGHFRRALATVEKLVSTRLRVAVAARLRHAAHSDPNLYGGLLASIAASRIRLERHEWVFPVVSPVGGVSVTNLDRFHEDGAWVAHAATPVTAHMADAGVSVLDLGAAGSVDPKALEAILVRVGQRQTMHVSANLTLVSRVDAQGTDAGLLAETRALLESTFRLPAGITLASLHGADDHRPWVTADNAPMPPRFLIDTDGSDRNPFFLLRRLNLVLNGDHPAVARIRYLARTDVQAAASLLVRFLLLDHEKLSIDRSEKLLTRRLASAFGDDS